MENAENALVLLYDMCRLCLDEPGVENISKPIDWTNDILTYTGVKVTPSDKLPQSICISCRDIISCIKVLKDIATTNDEQLQLIKRSNDNQVLLTDSPSHVVIITPRTACNNQNESSEMPEISSNATDRSCNKIVFESENEVTESKSRQKKKERHQKKRKSSLSKTEIHDAPKKLAVRADLFDSSGIVTSSTKQSKQIKQPSTSSQPENTNDVDPEQDKKTPPPKQTPVIPNPEHEKIQPSSIQSPVIASPEHEKIQPSTIPSPVIANPECRALEKLLQETLETSTLLACKGGAIDGDSARNLLVSAIAKEILRLHNNNRIRGEIYLRWSNAIKSLFPGENTTTYYAPACTTANGITLSARGKLVYQVLNKRKRLQKLGALAIKKRNIESSQPSSCRISQRSPPALLDDGICSNEVIDHLNWLHNSSDPWSIVLVKWKATAKERIRKLNDEESTQTIESYFEEFPALKNTDGYVLTSLERKIKESPSSTTDRHVPKKIKTLSVGGQEFKVFDYEYKCETCKKTYATHKKLYLHQLAHNKKFTCPLDACSKKFATKGDLHKHIRSHTGERPYKCNLCDQSFTQNVSLKAHKVKIHVEQHS